MEDEFVRETEVNPEEKPDVTYHYSYVPQKEEKKKGGSVLKTILLVVLCLSMGFAGGYFGSTMAIKNNKVDIDNATVFYQSVQLVDDKGNDVKDLSVMDISKMCSDSVVEISTEVVQYSIWMSQYVTGGSGSGVILSEDGYVVTCNHVIEGARKVVVRLTSGEEFEAVVVGTDPENDIAVLKIDTTGLKPVIIGKSDDLVVGEPVVAIGNPLGSLGGTVTNGIVSAKDREITIDNQTMRLIQTNAAVNPGNSGGALFNMSGELIGIVNAKSSGNNIEGLGFAIPIDSVLSQIDDLITKGYVSGKRALGISIADVFSKSYAAYYGVSEYGVYITEVNEGSLAEELGFEAMDRVVSINSVTINSTSDLKSIYGAIGAGEMCNFKIVRGTTEKTISFIKD